MPVNVYVQTSYASSKTSINKNISPLCVYLQRKRNWEPTFAAMNFITAQQHQDALCWINTLHSASLFMTYFLCSLHLSIV